MDVFTNVIDTFGCTCASARRIRRRRSLRLKSLPPHPDLSPVIKRHAENGDLKTDNVRCKKGNHGNKGKRSPTRQQRTFGGFEVLSDSDGGDIPVVMDTKSGETKPSSMDTNDTVKEKNADEEQEWVMPKKGTGAYRLPITMLYCGPLFYLINQPTLRLDCCF